MKKLFISISIAFLLVSCKQSPKLDGKILKDVHGNYYEVKHVFNNNNFKRSYTLIPVNINSTNVKPF